MSVKHVNEVQWVCDNCKVRRVHEVGGDPPKGWVLLTMANADGSDNRVLEYHLCEGCEGDLVRHLERVETPEDALLQVREEEEGEPEGRPWNEQIFWKEEEGDTNA